MRFTPLGNEVEVVAVRDRAAYHQQEYLLQRVSHPPRLTVVLNDGEMSEQRPKPRFLRHILSVKAHRGDLRIRPPNGIRFAASRKPPLTRVQSPARLIAVDAAPNMLSQTSVASTGHRYYAAAVKTSKRMRGGSNALWSAEVSLCDIWLHALYDFIWRQDCAFRKCPAVFAPQSACRVPGSCGP